MALLKKIGNLTQMSLFDEEPAPSLVPPPAARPDPGQPYFYNRTPVDQLIEQIKRDMAVLVEDPMYHQPSREFFEQRIAEYRAEVIKLIDNARRNQWG